MRVLVACLRYDAFEFFKWCYHYAFEKLGIPGVALENSLSLFFGKERIPARPKNTPVSFWIAVQEDNVYLGKR